LGIGSALTRAGPLSVLLGYSFTGIAVFAMMQCLGEMATWLPLPGAIPQFCARYVDDALGFAVGWNVSLDLHSVFRSPKSGGLQDPRKTTKLTRGHHRTGMLVQSRCVPRFRQLRSLSNIGLELMAFPSRYGSQSSL